MGVYDNVINLKQDNTADAMTKRLLIPKGANKYLKDAINTDTGKPFFKDRVGLPNGILSKNFPGIGATTLEIEAKRHSIIVSPTRGLSKTKCKSSESINWISCLYVSGDSKTSNNDIAKFGESQRFKKIFVVADSLPRVINFLGTSVFKDFFLLVDEIDTFQMDSSFRSSLEYAVDYFFKFEKAAAISATVIEFSDDKFKPQNIDYYTVELEEPAFPEIEILKSSHPNDSIASILSKLFLSNQKVVVAVNSIDLINMVIKTLDEFSLISIEHISVLCGKDSYKRIYAGVHREELIDGLLPNKINFITSAYFAGIDINEMYHSVILNSEYKQHTILSFENIHQIIGRGRKGLHSNKLVTFQTLFRDYSSLSREEIIDRVKRANESLVQTRKVYGDDYPGDLKALMANYTKLEIAGHKGFFRYNLDDELVPSNFTIDFKIQQHKIYTEYKSGLDALEEKLNRYYKVSHSFIKPSELLELSRLRGIDYIEAFADKFSQIRSAFIIEHAEVIDDRGGKVGWLTGTDAIMVGYAGEIYKAYTNPNPNGRRDYCAFIQMMLFEELYGLNEGKVFFVEFNKSGIAYKKFKRLILCYRLQKSASFNKFKEYINLDQYYSAMELQQILATSFNELNLEKFISEEDLDNNSTILEILRNLFKIKKRTLEIEGRRVVKHTILSFKSIILTKTREPFRDESIQKKFGADLEKYLLDSLKVDKL